MYRNEVHTPIKYFLTGDRIFFPTAPPQQTVRLSTLLPISLCRPPSSQCMSMKEAISLREAILIVILIFAPRTRTIQTSPQVRETHISEEFLQCVPLTIVCHTDVSAGAVCTMTHPTESVKDHRLRSQRLFGMKSAVHCASLQTVVEYSHPHSNSNRAHPNLIVHTVRAPNGASSSG